MCSLSQIIIIIIIIIILLFESFSHKRQPMVFHWILSDSKSPQVSPSFQDSSHYFGRPHLCSSLDGPHFSYFQVLQSA